MWPWAPDESKLMDDADNEIAEKREIARPSGKLNRSSDRVFKALADPTRRAIFERLSLGGELTVGALIKYCGVSQQAVAQHLSVLQAAGLVNCHRDHGRTNYYSARRRGAAPLLNWLAHHRILREQPTATPLAEDSATSLHKPGGPSPLLDRASALHHLPRARSFKSGPSRGSGSK
jgi:DNA-binding transcriptional ArsR family regulator